MITNKGTVLATWGRYNYRVRRIEDGGTTWGPVTPSKIQHPIARFFISRLHSGNILLVKHGPIDMRTGSSHLMAFPGKIVEVIQRRRVIMI